MSSLGNINKEAIVNSLLSLVGSDKSHLLGGMTNKNYLVSYIDNQYVIRMPGSATEMLINRENECENSMLTAKEAINIDTLYINPKTGVKITKYLPNSETFSASEKSVVLLANQLKTLHRSGIVFKNEFNVFTEYDKYILINEEKRREEKRVEDNQNIDEKLLALFNLCRVYFVSLNREKVPCHNDLVPENILLQGDNLYIIDWEYSGMNDFVFDIASFFIETNLSEEFQNLFLEEYFERGNVDIEQIKQEIILYQFCQDILWYIWTLIKEEDYTDYGQIRLNRAKDTAQRVSNFLKIN